MKHFFTLLLFIGFILAGNAQPATMLEREQPGVGIAAGALLSDGYTGLSIDAGYKFNERVDMSASIGIDIAGDIFSSTSNVKSFGIQASYWFISKELGSDVLLKTGVIGGAAYGRVHDTFLESFAYDMNISTFQGFGGLGALMNYNPGGGNFILQPSVSAVYAAGWEFYKYGSRKDTYSIDQMLVTGGLSFGFKMGSGSVLSLIVSQVFSDTEVDPIGLGVELAFPVK